MLKTLTLSHFTAPVTVDEGFENAMILMDNLLEKHGLKMKPNDTIRYVGHPVAGAIVQPASHSNHFIGHAIDGNLINPVTGHVFLHEEMQSEKDPRVKAFIEDWEKAGMRWGGIFGGDAHPEQHDAVHFDSGLNVHNPEKWKELFNEYQNGK
jgi:hypothetical protein